MNDTNLNKAVERELKRQWYGLRDPSLFRMYGRSREQDRRTHTLFTLKCAATIYLTFATFDYFLIPDVFLVTTIIRFILAGLSIAIVVWMFNSGKTADLIDDISGLLIIACYAGWLFSAVQTSDGATLSYYLVFGAMFMMMTSLFFDFPPGIAMRTCVAILIGGLLSVFWLPTATTEYQIALSVFYVGSYSAISYVNWKLDRERYQVFLNALQAQLRQKEVEQRGLDLLALSRTDPLTALDNRRAVDEKLNILWQNWLNHAQTFAVLLVDVDYFKAYNDHYGHQDGDQCLVTLAESFRAIALSKHCTVGRYGGEEFIFLVTEDDTNAVTHLAESIRSSVERLGLIHDRRPDGRKTVTISIGVAFSHTSNRGNLEFLIEASDRALYRAKDQGRNRVEIFDPFNPPPDHRDDDIAALLDTAIDSGLVSMNYQPIVETSTGRTIALESLMRLECPNGGSIAPEIFIPIAESTGHIMSLGRWALLTACRDILVANKAETVSVNVSVVQLKTPGFALYTAALLGRLKIEPKRLALEITDSHAIDDHPEAIGCLAELKSLGVKIWLDDFGSGHAGLSWFKTVDFDFVKIDRSLLQESLSGRDRSMLRDLIRLMRHRGHEMIVEGVETEQQLDVLNEHGILYAQGYHLGHPTSVTELPKRAEDFQFHGDRPGNRRSFSWKLT